MNRLTASSCALLAALSIVSTGSSACSGGGGGGRAAAAEVSFDGPWTGTWSTAGASSSAASATASSGTVTLQLVQSGASLTGTATFVGHPCLATCTVSCQVQGHGVSGWFQAGSVPASFSGSCPGSGPGPGTHHADALTGTFRIEGGPCAGGLGTIQLTPAAAVRGTPTGADLLPVGELLLVDPASGEVTSVPVLERP